MTWFHLIMRINLEKSIFLLYHFFLYTLLMTIKHLKWENHIQIGLDLDETLASTFEWFLAYAQSHGQLLHIQSIEQIRKHDASWLGNHITSEEIGKIWEWYGKSTLSPESVPLVQDSLEWVRKIHELGKSISIVTARSNQESWKAERTTRWVRSHFSFLDDSSIHFVNHFSSDALPKSVVCKKYGISLMIDDAMENAHELTNNGISCILLERPWNRDAHCDHPLLHRVKNWKEIIDSIPHVRA